MTRNVTAEPVDPAERFALYRLCECVSCAGRGKVPADPAFQHLIPEASMTGVERCAGCRGEGRTRDLMATCATPEAVGVALYTLALEGEWDECPIGILDRLPTDPDHPKWLVKPWLPSARNLSDAGRQLQAARKGKP